MAGVMRKRGSSWELRVYAGRNALTGKKQWATRTFKGTQREAERALAAFVTEVDRGLTVAAGVTVGELLERWFEHPQADFSPKTVLETRGYIDRNLLPGLGAVRLSKLRTDDLDRYYAALRARGGASGTPLAPGTIRRIHGIVVAAVLRTVFVHPNATEISDAWDRTATMLDGQFPRVKDLMDTPKPTCWRSPVPGRSLAQDLVEQPPRAAQQRDQATHEHRADLRQRRRHRAPRRRSARRATRRLGHAPPLPLRRLHGEALHHARQ
ncbi:MAG: hypothetical protein F2754_10800 [Actinobacteria bacterium]|nr:hypothetical protein [Actinomycetota bacterium]MSW92324.1 hypothetical protein [Actinomycetota bacterium]MSX87862.1 hypothetical protein [Actinomycetota bacterium]MSY71568.1 hypothetical protein [Actinomycetota bacterium]